MANQPAKYAYLGLIVCLVGGAAAAPPEPAAPGRIRFPHDKAVIDARRDFGARGDGVADDTDALQRALDASSGTEGGPSRVLFLPDGTYRVTRTLVIHSPIGPWLYGESRDGAVIRLDDHVRDCNSVLRTHPREDGPTSADWFMRNIRNVTIDAGDNPDTDGIRFYANNTGILKDVRVVGRGKVGVNAGFLGQSGPNLVQDVMIDGFETGVLSQWIWGQTLSRVTIRNCRNEGLVVIANAVGVEDLAVEGVPVPLRCDLPNDWHHWGGVVALTGARFTGGKGGGPAVLNRGVLYARGVRAAGYSPAIRSEAPSGDAGGPDVAEYLSHDVKHLFEPAPPRSLHLPVKREPVVPWENDPAKWVCANDYGAIPGDNRDDAAAIQAAIDAAAAGGKTTVYLRGIGGGDPNWYDLKQEVRVHGTVRRVMGLGFGRILGADGGALVVADDPSPGAAPVVKFQHLDAFGGTPITIANRSAARTVAVESCGVHVVGAGRGDLFVTDVSGSIHLQSAGQRLWARQLNPEGKSDTGLVRNDGGDLWALGVKHEGAGVRFSTTAGGRTEVLGLFNYGPGIDEADRRPMFDVDNASFSVAGLREITFGDHAWFVKVRERRGDDVRTLGSDREEGWIGWALYRSSQEPAAR